MMNSVNIFTNYVQEENHFTNGLIGLLHLSTYHDPHFVNSFLNNLLSLASIEPVDCFRVLRNVSATEDAVICGKNCCVMFETKILSATLRKEQICNHLEQLKARSEPTKRLVLLTPDDSRSQYISQLLSIDRHHLFHLGWKSVSEYLANFAAHQPETLFSELLREFLDRIRDRVFQQDIAGIIQKIDFGSRSSVYNNVYLEEMRQGLWAQWRTPRQYKHLDGTGRKLMLYDKVQKGITVEVEIKEVKRTDQEPSYPWSNIFVPDTLFIFPEPLPLTRIQMISGFENFGKERSAYRVLTQEQYRKLCSR
jgi:hypothetical protein